MSWAREKHKTSLESCNFQDFKNVRNFHVALTIQKLFRSKANPQKVLQNLAIKLP